MEASNWLILITIFVALFGERSWKFIDKRSKRKEVRVIIKRNLQQLNSDLIRIRDERNQREAPMVIFNSTSFSEVNGYYFLFSQILLPNLAELELSKYPNTIDFFIHYKINMETIRIREQNRPGTGKLTLETVDRLLSKLNNSIREFS